MEYNIFLGAADTPDPPGGGSQVGPFYLHLIFPAFKVCQNRFLEHALF
jgi:hypothetical protein